MADSKSLLPPLAVVGSRWTAVCRRYDIIVSSSGASSALSSGGSSRSRYLPLFLRKSFVHWVSSTAAGQSHSFSTRTAGMDVIAKLKQHSSSTCCAVLRRRCWVWYGRYDG